MHTSADTPTPAETSTPPGSASGDRSTTPTPAPTPSPAPTSSATPSSPSVPAPTPSPSPAPSAGGPPARFALFDTAIGRCALGWNERGVSSVQLPGASDARLAARLRGRLPKAVEAAPPPPVGAVIERIVRLLAGAEDDLRDVPLDMAGVPEFNRRVYAVARAIPVGATLTYGAVANRIGAPGSARAVGRALGENPFPIIVPCHRVTAADGGFGGFSAPGGRETKLAMLAAEGAVLPF